MPVESARALRMCLPRQRQRLGIDFPPDYVAFMLESNCGEGPVGADGYLQLWPAETLVENGFAYDATRSYPGHVLISDGGGEAVAVRRGESEVEIGFVPFVGGVQHARVGGSSLTAFLKACGSGRI